MEGLWEMLSTGMEKGDQEVFGIILLVIPAKPPLINWRK